MILTISAWIFMGAFGYAGCLGAFRNELHEEVSPVMRNSVILLACLMFITGPLGLFTTMICSNLFDNGLKWWPR